MDEYQFLKDRTEKRKRAQHALEEATQSLQELLAGYGVEVDEEIWEMVRHTPIRLACEEKRRLEYDLWRVDRGFEKESLDHDAASAMPEVELEGWNEQTFWYSLPDAAIGIGTEGENYRDAEYKHGMMAETTHALYRIVLAKKGIHTERAEGVGEWYDLALSWQAIPELLENEQEYLKYLKDIVHWDYLYLQTRDRFKDPQAAARWVARNVIGPKRLEKYAKRLEKYEKSVQEEKKEKLFNILEDRFVKWFKKCSEGWRGAHLESSGIAWPILAEVSKRQSKSYRDLFDRMSMVAAKALINEEVNHLSVESYVSTVIQRIPHYLDEYLGE